jgi:hypothetical protein
LRAACFWAAAGKFSGVEFSLASGADAPENWTAKVEYLTGLRRAGVLMFERGAAAGPGAGVFFSGEIGFPR